MSRLEEPAARGTMSGGEPLLAGDRMRPDHTTNTLGLLCPLPLLFAVRDMTRLETGQTLELVGDDPGLLEDIPSWCNQSGHVLREVEVDEGVIVCRIEKGTRAHRPRGTVG